ncbi:hypothetical protein AS888_13030 [Peribacillus simplex]|uniref:Uncharacterized protein n=1 Tax=Peribacillus simplex TaxID=1478 RepID=A0A120GR67_9BACI|nr:hypothetical protein AS888_13030 [Peribacillus simplex]
MFWQRDAKVIQDVDAIKRLNKIRYKAFKNMTKVREPEGEFFRMLLNLSSLELLILEALKH